MRSTQSRKEVSHERILQAASRSIRSNGYAGTGVAEVMKAANLTHGGFYAHFSSREEMLAAAADRAGTETVARLSEIADAAPAKMAYQALIKAYLSRAHADLVGNGCPVAALGSETPRQTAEIRRVATQRIKDMLDLVERHCPSRGQPDAKIDALSATATMVGALMMARAVDDQELSDALLLAAIQKLTGD